MKPDVSSLVLVAAIAAAAPLITHLLGRWVAVPLVVFEILFGILLGPQGTDWILADPYIAFVSTLGLTMLFLLAGYELDFGRIRGRPLRRSAVGWLGSVALGVLLGLLLALVRGIPATTAGPRGAGLGERAAIALFAATGLPIIVAVTTIGLDHGELTRSTAAALVGAGMLSVLVFPLLALSVGRRTRRT